MDYKHFTTWDFVNDAYFVEWVLKPDEYSSKFWESFISENNDKSEEILLAKEIISGIKYQQSPALEDADYHKLYARIKSSKREIEHKRQSKFIKISSKSWLKYAASVIIIATATILYMNRGSQLEDMPLKEIIMSSSESPKGSHLTTMLSDGTRVKLNGGSKITFPKEFNSDDSVRSVYLVGEAFFEVARDPHRPFHVVSDFVTTEVLGTSFNVKAYPEDKTVAVAVAEGKVKVTNTQSAGIDFEHILLPNQESQLNIAANEAIKSELQDASAFSWTKWQLTIKNESTQEILKILERWYGVRFEIEGSLNQSETYSGTFDNDPLKVVLEALKSQGAFDYDLNDRENIKISIK